jgi:hypothetical protein
MTHEHPGLSHINELDLEIVRLSRINTNYTMIHGDLIYFYTLCAISGIYSIICGSYDDIGVPTKKYEYYC